LHSASFALLPFLSTDHNQQASKMCQLEDFHFDCGCLEYIDFVSRCNEVKLGEECKPWNLRIDRIEIPYWCNDCQEAMIEDHREDNEGEVELNTRYRSLKRDRIGAITSWFQTATGRLRAKLQRPKDPWQKLSD
jgi:hypothetical protein